MLKSVLYIDDEPINLESFKMQFGSTFDIFTAESAYEAYSILKNNEIKVVISDQRMPEISGIELLEFVKKNYPQVIRILLTAYLQEEYLLEAINRGGVYRYLTKPWNSVELKSTISTAIESFNLKKENQNLIGQLKDKVNQLIISEEKFRNIFNSSSDGILLLDNNAVILNINKTFCNLVNANPGELIGKNFIKYLPEEIIDIFFQHSVNSPDYQNTTVNFRLQLNSSRSIFVRMKSNAIEYEGCMAQLVVLTDITHEKEFENKLYAAQLFAEEKERERISRDLHDGIGPLLSTLKIYLSDIKKTVPENICSNSIIKASEIINDSIASVKEISNNISPHILRNFGLTQALREFIERLRIAPDVKLHFNTNLENRINDLTEVTLYRISTELINNSIKYSGARNITLQIQSQNSEIKYEFKDDGKGFDYVRELNFGKGSGIKNIHSRVQYIGGNIKYKSEPEKGLEIRIDLKIP